MAVKVLREAQRMDLAARHRFLREAQLLSQLQHPNVCQLYGHVEGSDEGGDFLILELIEGRSLAALAPGELREAAKMRIAAQLLDALAAAHHRGVVHRDLKPANVMLASGEVKVLDFGLARTVDEAQTVATAAAAPAGANEPGLPGAPAESELAATPGDVHTQQGSILGTLAYMSPEQARGEPATPASDVYSCGLVLQELFTGERAYARNLSPAVLLQQVAAAETRPIVGLDPDLAALLVRMKSPAPGARPSADDARDRVEWIRKKPLRRTRRAAVAVALVALAAVAMTLAFQARRIREEAARANREAEAAREVAGFLVTLFEVSDPGEARGNDVKARELLDVGARRLASELASQPLTRARLMGTIGTVYTRLGLYDEAAPLLDEALSVRRRESGPASVEAASGLYELSELYLARGEHDAAVGALEEALALRRRLLGADHPDVGRALGLLGLVFEEKGELERAQEALERASAILAESLGAGHREAAACRSDLGLVLRARGRLAEAQALLEAVVPALETAAGPDHPDTARALTALASVYHDQGRYREAAELLARDLAISEKVFGPDHRDVAISLNNLGQVYRRSGRLREAVPLFERSLAIRRRLGEDHPLLAAAFNNLASVAAATGELGRAESLFREAIARWERAFGPHYPNLASGLRGLAEVLRDTGRPAEAEPLFRRSLAIRVATFGPSHPNVARNRVGLASVLRLRGALAEAEEELRQAVESLTAAGEDSPDLPEALEGRAAVELDRGRPDAAAASLERALAALDRAVAAGPGDLAARERKAAVLAGLARVARARGDAALAARHSQVALAELDRIGDETSMAAVALRVELLAGLDRGAEAEPLRRRLTAAGWRL